MAQEYGPQPPEGGHEAVQQQLSNLALDNQNLTSSTTVSQAAVITITRLPSGLLRIRGQPIHYRGGSSKGSSSSRNRIDIEDGFPRFTLFTRLPIELRCKIWGYALPGQRIIELFRKNAQGHTVFSTAAHLPVHHIRLACREAEEVVLKRYKLVPAIALAGTSTGTHAHPSMHEISWDCKVPIDFETDVFEFVRMKNSNTFLKLVDDQGRVKTTAFMPETFKFWIQPPPLGARPSDKNHLLYSYLSSLIGLKTIIFEIGGSQRLKSETITTRFSSPTVSFYEPTSEPPNKLCREVLEKLRYFIGLHESLAHLEGVEVLFADNTSGYCIINWESWVVHFRHGKLVAISH